MQKWPMANNIFQCYFLLQPLLHRLLLVILTLLSRPRYQRIIGHMPNVLKIFCFQLRPYGPVIQLDLQSPVETRYEVKAWKVSSRQWDKYSLPVYISMYCGAYNSVVARIQLTIFAMHVSRYQILKCYLLSNFQSIGSFKSKNLY